MTLASLVGQFIDVLCAVLMAPVLTGWVNQCRAWLQNRTAPPLLQPYRMLHKLFNKDSVVAREATPLFRITPYVVFGAMTLACGIIPTLSTNLPLAHAADALALVGLFALARVFLALAAMDIGTAFGTLGARREMLVGFLAEPALLMVLFTGSLGVLKSNMISFQPPLSGDFHEHLAGMVMGRVNKIVIDLDPGFFAARDIPVDMAIELLDGDPFADGPPRQRSRVTEQLRKVRIEPSDLFRPQLVLRCGLFERVDDTEHERPEATRPLGVSSVAFCRTLEGVRVSLRCFGITIERCCEKFEPLVPVRSSTDHTGAA